MADNQYMARIGIDELRTMSFSQSYPCRDEYVVYSMIAEMGDALLKFGYSAIIDSTAPFNVTRQFLLTTKIKPVNPLLIVVSAERPILPERSLEKFGDDASVAAYDKRW